MIAPRTGSITTPGCTSVRQFLSFFGRALAVVLVLVAVVAVPVSTAVGSSSEEVLTFTLLHTNDEHSNLIPHSPAVDYDPEGEDATVGGAARLAAAVSALREEREGCVDREGGGEPVLLVSAADYLGGAPFAWLNYEGLAPELDIMQEIGYDVVTIGNHEFDYGPEALADYLKAAGYPEAVERTRIVASNILPPADHPLAGMGIESSHLRELENGLRVGFIGLLGEDAIQKTYRTDPIAFTDPFEAARGEIEALRERGADVIVAITHSGLEEDIELAREVDGIDIIVGGHCHTTLEEPLEEGGAIIVQAGESLEYLGILELSFDPSTGKSSVRNQKTGTPHLLPIDGRITPDPGIEAMVDEYTEALSSMVYRLTDGGFDHILDPVVHSDFPVPLGPGDGESPLGNLITDAMRLSAGELLGERVDFAFQASGSIRGDLIPGGAGDSRGQVSFYDLALITGLGSGYDKAPGYPLVSFHLTGGEVRRVLEISALLSRLLGGEFFLHSSGLRYEYDPRRSVLATVPVLDLPLPTGRSVMGAEYYTGEGLQTDDEGDYLPLKRGDEELYRVTTDYYLLQFLPLVGELAPHLALEIKDREGRPIDDMRETIIESEGRELKVWRVVVDYAAGLPEEEGLARIPRYYSREAGRAVRVEAFPLQALAAVPALAVLGLLLVLLRRRRRAPGA